MTAPHGPSERMPDALAEKLARADLEAFGEDDIPPWSDLTPEERRDAIDETRASLAPYYPLIQAEVRAAVVAEVLAIVEGEAAKQRRLASDAAASKGLGVMHFVAGTEADAIATAIRAQLPPVSAPGPTLPPLPDGWTVEVRYQDRQSEPAGPLWIATNPDGERIRYSVGVWRCGLIICGSQDTASESRAPEAMAHLFALRSAHLASRAERGPGDATPGEGEGD